MHKVWFGAVAAVLLVTQGLASQEAAAQEEEAYDSYADAFVVEPLTPEQEARMPTARRVVELAMPEGTYIEAMGSLFGVSTYGAGVIEPDPLSAIYSALAYAPSIGEIATAKAEQAISILDPAWRERQQAELDAQTAYARALAARFDPLMRQALTELYAIRFTQRQLEDIEAFYRTESGAALARESLSLATDPRISATIYSQPELWEATVEPVTGALAALPAARSFEELSPRERAHVAALTGITEAELEEAMRQAVEINTAVEAAADAVTEAADEHGH